MYASMYGYIHCLCQDMAAYETDPRLTSVKPECIRDLTVCF